MSLSTPSYTHTMFRPHPDAETLIISCASARWKSDSLTVIETPPGIDSNMIVKNAYAKYDLSIGIGLSQVNGKVCVKLGSFVGNWS